MMTLKNTIENKAKIEALKTIKETWWVGNITFDNLDKCLASINMNTSNSGWYQPIPVEINGLSGIFVINEDGSLFFEQRIIKLADKFLIEFLSDAGYTQFEKKYSEVINELTL
jgi:hypothetical protein